MEASSCLTMVTGIHMHGDTAWKHVYTCLLGRTQVNLLASE